MSILTLQIEVDDLSAAQLANKINYANAETFVSTFTNLLQGQVSGILPVTTVIANQGAVKASGTITFSSTGPVADETVTVNGVVFTAKASGATGDEFNRSNTPSVNATNLAAAINASASTGVAQVTASASGAVVTVTCDVAGVIGNNFTLAESATNTAVSGANFASGSNGTSTTL